MATLVPIFCCQSQSVLALSSKSETRKTSDKERASNGWNWQGTSEGIHYVLVCLSVFLCVWVWVCVCVCVCGCVFMCVRVLLFLLLIFIQHVSKSFTNIFTLYTSYFICKTQSSKSYCAAAVFCDYLSCLKVFEDYRFANQELQHLRKAFEVSLYCILLSV